MAEDKWQIVDELEEVRVYVRTNNGWSLLVSINKKDAGIYRHFTTAPEWAKLEILNHE